MRFFRHIFLGLNLALLMGCQDDPGQNIAITSHFRRFDRAFFRTDTAHFDTALARLRQAYPVFFGQDATTEFWRHMRTEPLQRELYQKVQEVFGSMTAENRRLNQAMKRYYHYFGTEDTLAFYAYISRLDFEYPVLYADSLVFAALDLYLGSDAPYYQQLPRYLAYQRQPAFLVRDVLSAVLKARQPPLPPQPTLLEAMVYHGKRAYILHQLLPDLSLARIFKFRPNKLRFVEEHEAQMWAYFIEQELLFKRDQRLLRRFIVPAPFSKFRTKLDAKTPGRIGHWYGYLLVKEYMEERPGTSLPQLLQGTSARDILRLSGYQP